MAALIDGHCFESFFQLGLFLLLADVQQVLPAQHAFCGWSSQVLHDRLQLFKMFKKLK
jgi:hypothetical protein